MPKHYDSHLNNYDDNSTINCQDFDILYTSSIAHASAYLFLGTGFGGLFSNVIFIFFLKGTVTISVRLQNVIM